MKSLLALVLSAALCASMVHGYTIADVCSVGIEVIYVDNSVLSFELNKQNTQGKMVLKEGSFFARPPPPLPAQY
jgi:hypothetical protein